MTENIVRGYKSGIRRGGEVGFFGLKKPGIGVVYSLDLKPKKNDLASLWFGLRHEEAVKSCS